MSIPSLRVDDHHRFTPQTRDEVLDKLRRAGRATGGPTYGMLTAQHLAEFESPSAPVISMYLQLTPDRRVGGAWAHRLQEPRCRDAGADYRQAQAREADGRAAADRGGAASRPAGPRPRRGLLHLPDRRAVAADRSVAAAAGLRTCGIASVHPTVGAHAR